MKKAFYIILSLAFIIALSTGIVASAESATPTFTRDVEVDYNVFKGDIGGKQCAVVWSDVDKKYSKKNEYGHFIYKSVTDEKKIDVTKGFFDKANEGEESFATSYDLSKLEKNVEYSVKAYVKSSDGKVKLSRTTAVFKNVDSPLATDFEVKTSGSHVVCDSQDVYTNFSGGENDTNTQYYVYVNGQLVGATTKDNYDENFEMLWSNVGKKLRYDIHEVIFKYNQTEGRYEYEDGDYNITIKTMSGLNNGGVSSTVLKVKTLLSEPALLNIGTSQESLASISNNTYYVLGRDMDLTGANPGKCDSLDGAGDTVKANGCYYIINKYFNDTLDGLGHKLTATYYNVDQSTQKEFGGLFAKIGDTGAIKNLNYFLDATYAYKQTMVAGEGNGLRACAVSYFSSGSMDNCFIHAKMNSNKNVRREALFGQASVNVHENVIYKLELFENNMPVTTLTVTETHHDDSTGKNYIWESLYQTKLVNVVAVSPITWTSGAGGLGGGGEHINCTLYNSYDDLLSGQNGRVMDNSDISISVGDVREGKISEIGEWQEEIWNFTENKIEFFGNTLFEN